MKYNKLVRDKIPAIITQQGLQPVTRILETAAYRQELRKKLQEEVTEFESSGQAEELADILEVIYALAAETGLSPSQLEELRQQKHQKRGGFGERVFLVEVISG